MTKFADLPEKTLLRPDEVAKFFSVSVQTVYNWHNEGKIEGYKTPGKPLRFLRQAIVESLIPTGAD